MSWGGGKKKEDGKKEKEKERDIYRERKKYRYRETEKGMKRKYTETVGGKKT